MTTQLEINERKNLITQIDEAAAHIYKKHSRFLAEYIEAGKQATEFSNNNYLGVVPPMVIDYQIANNLTPKEACIDILNSANKLNHLMQQVRAARMKKALVRDANTQQEALQIAKSILDTLGYLYTL